MVIDDSSTSLMLMEYTLKEAGYNVVVFSDVSGAVNFLKDITPSLILLDLSMPGISGYDFLKMRFELKIDKVPIIVVSAYDTERSRTTIKKLGALEFLAKPFKVELLLKTISTYLKKEEV